MKTAFECFEPNQQWSPRVVPDSANVMSTRHSLTLLASVGLFFGVYATGNAEAADSPNIVFIMADDLGAGKRIRKGLRMGDWKAVQMNPAQPIELFNLATDESETTDVADRHPEVMAKIRSILATCRTEARPQIEPPGTGDWRFR